MTNLTLIIERLIDAGSNISATDGVGHTPLHLAALKSAAVTRSLLAAGADIHVLNEDGKIPLQRAKEYFQRYGNRDEGAKIIELLETSASESN